MERQEKSGKLRPVKQKKLFWELLKKVSDQWVRKLSPGDDVEADDPIIPNGFKPYGLHI